MTTLRKATMIRMPRELDNQFAQVASKKGVSKNSVMLEALWQYASSNEFKSNGGMNNGNSGSHG